MSIKIALIAPSGTFQLGDLARATARAQELGFEIVFKTGIRTGCPGFLHGQPTERLAELKEAEQIKADAVWCARGGCGAVQLWADYQASIFQYGQAPLIGYSDITILHFLRHLRAGRIGIHGPVFLELMNADEEPIEALRLLVWGKAEQVTYPTLTILTQSIEGHISGELIPMNLASLQSIIGCFASDFFRGKILALEDVNEPPYKVFRMMHHLKNAGILAGLKGLIIGYFGEEREKIIEEIMKPLAHSQGIPLFDWPIFGHERPNWPLLFGARVNITNIAQPFFSLTYQEQHDHRLITYDEIG